MKMDNETIIKYILGQLEKFETEEFEKEMAINPALKEEVELQKEMELYLERRIISKKAIDNLKSIHAEYAEQPTKEIISKTKKIWPYLRAAVLVSILMTASFLIYREIATKPSFTNQELFVQFFDPGELSFSTKSAETDSLLTLAEFNFNKSDFLKTIALLEQAQSSDSILNAQFNYYSGLSYLALENTGAAREKFEEAKSITNLLRSDIDWFTALSYLKEENIEQAKIELSKISAESVHYTNATELLKSF